MKSILRATFLLGGSSALSIVVGLVSAKAWALLLRPDGLGYMGLLQSLTALCGLVVAMGLGTGVIRQGANALGNDDHEQFAALRRAAWLLSLGLGLVGALLLVVFRSAISRLWLGSAEHSTSVALMGLVVLLSQISTFQTSILNAHHRVGALARLGLLYSLLSTAVSLALVWRLGDAGIVPAIIAGAAVLLMLSQYFVSRIEPQPAARPSWPAVRSAMSKLLRFGGPYTASMFAGMGAQLLIPTLVLHELGETNVGLYRAASAIAATYLGFLLSAMVQDYYPRVSRISDRPAELVDLVNQQQRLLNLLAVPVILGALAAVPWLVPLVYSREFAPAAGVLEWYLVGDLFKFSSWTLGFVLLARRGSITFFLVECLAGFNIVAMSLVGMKLFQVSGLGVAFLGTYVIHFVVVWLIVRRDIGFRWTAANRRTMLVALSAALLVQALPLVGLASWKLPLATALAVLFGIASLHSIWHEIGGLKHVRAWWLGRRSATLGS